MILRCSGSEGDWSTQRSTSSIRVALENEVGFVKAGRVVDQGADVFMKSVGTRYIDMGGGAEGAVPQPYLILAM